MRGPGDGGKAKAGLDRLAAAVTAKDVLVSIRWTADGTATRLAFRGAGALEVVATGWIGGAFVALEETRDAIDLELHWQG